MSRRRLTPSISRSIATLVAVLSFGASGAYALGAPPYQRMPSPSAAPLPVRPGAQTAVFGGGCFWGAQEVFSHLRGVRKVVAGYAGGDFSNANYRAVGSGVTGHVESVEVTFDPTEISYDQLLTVFTSVVVDPTEANGQGPDHGPQYSAVIFYDDAQRRKRALDYLSQLNANVLAGKGVVRVQRDHGFFPAEPFHQNYAETHPKDPYILQVDAPKMAALQRLFPELYRAGDA